MANQLAATVSILCLTRRSRATMSIGAICPPWEFRSTSFFTPAAATQSPISIHIAIKVWAEKVSVPSHSECSFDFPTGSVGRNSAGQSSGINGTVAAMMPSRMA